MAWEMNIIKILLGACAFAGTESLVSGRTGRRFPWRSAGMACVGGNLAALLSVRCLETKGQLSMFAFFCVLEAATVWDLDTMEIPDGCHIAGLALTVVSVFAVPGIPAEERLVGAMCVSVPMLLLALAVPGVFGGGDVKLTAVCGLFLGWRAMLVSVGIAIVAAGIYGMYLIVIKRAGRRACFAMGPFLCAGAAAGALYGEQLFAWCI